MCEKSRYGAIHSGYFLPGWRYVMLESDISGKELSEVEINGRLALFTKSGGRDEDKKSG